MLKTRWNDTRVKARERAGRRWPAAVQAACVSAAAALPTLSHACGGCAPLVQARIFGDGFWTHLLAVMAPLMALAVIGLVLMPVLKRWDRR